MAKKDVIEAIGTVVDAQPNAVFKVKLENGFEVPISCEQGVCGTCITRVVAGTPDHRDVFMTDDEHSLNNQFTPCCSRAKSKTLVIDLA